MRLPNWLRLSLKPDELIGEHEMRRWWLLPQNTLVNVYLHGHTGNDPRYPHDHPCDNISIRIRGDLVEYTPATIHDVRELTHAIIAPDSHAYVYFNDFEPCVVRGLLGRFTWRRAEEAHRLEMPHAGAVAWTIWIRFRNRRRWGFFEAMGWRPAKTVRQP